MKKLFLGGCAALVAVAAYAVPATPALAMSCYPSNGPAAGDLAYRKRIVVASRQCRSGEMWIIGGRNRPTHINRECGCVDDYASRRSCEAPRYAKRRSCD